MRLKNFQEAHRLFKEGKNKTQIAKYLEVSRPTVIQWLAQETYQETRGWREGRARKYHNPATAKRICSLKQQRIDHNYFVGSDHVQKDYAQRFRDVVPSTRYIDRVVREAGLQTRTPKQKRRGGGSVYLLYPVQCIANLRGVHQSGDFIGKKYIAGSSDPVNIFSTSYYRPFKLYQIQRILAETSACAIEVLKEQWKRYPIPNVFRLDNALQFRGTGSGKRAIGTFLKFLLNLRVTPLFGSPSKPWTNPHVEGHNRVFNEKVWGKNWFTNHGQIDTECGRFNQESQELLQFKYGPLIFNSNFDYLEPKRKIVTDRLETTKGKKIHFIRFVESLDQRRTARIIILNEMVSVPVQYTHQFVFAEWDLEQETLSMYSEYQKVITLIKQMKFRINL